MNMNSYSSPKAAGDEPLADAIIHCRMFRAQPVLFKLSSRTQHLEVRREAQYAIDQDIGAGNVIPIIEHAEEFDSYPVVVCPRCTVTSTVS